MVLTSSIRGTFLSRHSSSVSRQAARIGRTAFLEPLIGTRPTNRVPPSIRSWATDPLGEQSRRVLSAASAPEFGEPKSCLRARQGNRGGRLVHVRQLLLQQVRR